MHFLHISHAQITRASCAAYYSPLTISRSLYSEALKSQHLKRNWSDHHKLSANFVVDGFNFNFLFFFQERENRRRPPTMINRPSRLCVTRAAPKNKDLHFWISSQSRSTPSASRMPPMGPSQTCNPFWQNQNRNRFWAKPRGKNWAIGNRRTGPWKWRRRFELFGQFTKTKVQATHLKLRWRMTKYGSTSQINFCWTDENLFGWLRLIKL